VKAAVVRAFLDAADDLLAAQQQLMPQPLPEELRAPTEGYIARREALIDETQAATLQPPEGGHSRAPHQRCLAAKFTARPCRAERRFAFSQELSSAYPLMSVSRRRPKCVRQRAQFMLFGPPAKVKVVWSVVRHEPVEAARRRLPHPDTVAALRAALEAAGVEFIAANGGGAGVRLRKTGS
jgi:hypothetical protein